MSDASEDAREMATNFFEQIIDQVLEDQEVSDDIYKYDESYHHETHIDKYYTLREAVDIIEEYGEFEETDSGLWQGCDFKTSLTTCAAFTYGNAVYSCWIDLVNEINDEISNNLTLQELLERYNEIDLDYDEDTCNEELDDWIKELKTKEQVRNSVEEIISKVIDNF